MRTSGLFPALHAACSACPSPNNIVADRQLPPLPCAKPDTPRRHRLSARPASPCRCVACQNVCCFVPNKRPARVPPAQVHGPQRLRLCLPRLCAALLRPHLALALHPRGLLPARRPGLRLVLQVQSCCACAWQQGRNMSGRQACVLASCGFACLAPGLTMPPPPLANLPKVPHLLQLHHATGAAAGVLPGPRIQGASAEQQLPTASAPTAVPPAARRSATVTGRDTHACCAAAAAQSRRRAPGPCRAPSASRSWACWPTSSPARCLALPTPSPPSSSPSRRARTGWWRGARCSAPPGSTWLCTWPTRWSPGWTCS